MVTQTVTIDRIPHSTTVKDVIRNVLGSDISDLDQHVLFYVYNKREKRIKSTTHLHRLLARSKHRVHFVVKRRVKPRCQSSFSTKAKLLLQNMRSLFNEEERIQTKANHDQFPTFDALNTECKRRRLTGDASNVYLSTPQCNVIDGNERRHLRQFALDTLPSEFGERAADTDRCHNGLSRAKNQTFRDNHSHCSIERAIGSGSKTNKCKANNDTLMRKMLKTIHPSKLYGVVTSLPEYCLNKSQYENQPGTKKRKLEATSQYVYREESNFEESNTTSDQGDYVLLKGQTEPKCKNGNMIEDWDSAFEDDNDISV